MTPPAARPPALQIAGDDGEPMTVEIEGVALHLAHPDEVAVQWVQQDELMRQLPAAWMVVASSSPVHWQRFPAPLNPSAPTVCQPWQRNIGAGATTPIPRPPPAVWFPRLCSSALGCPPDREDYRWSAAANPDGSAGTPGTGPQTGNPGAPSHEWLRHVQRLRASPAGIPRNPQASTLYIGVEAVRRSRHGGQMHVHFGDYETRY